MAPLRGVVIVDGYRINYLAAGSGPPLVLIPGLLQSAELWSDVGYIERLSEEHRVVAVDPVGHGRSDSAQDGSAYGPEAVVAQLVAVLEAEHIAEATAWGYGTGGEYATILARRRPDLVSRVVVGGLFLGEVREAYVAAGLDQEVVIDLAAKALDVNDWDAYFDLTLWEGPDHYERRLMTDNDPSTVATQLRSELLRARGFVMPGVPTFAYWGKKERFQAANAQRAEMLPLEYAVLGGDQGETFLAIDEVIGVVMPFLGSTIRS